MDFLNTIPSTVWAALIGAIVALLANVIVTPWIAAIARRSEERRWYLDHFMPLRITSLHKFYSLLVSTYGKLDRWRNLYGERQQLEKNSPLLGLFDKYDTRFQKEVGMSNGPFDAALGKAWVFLDGKARKVMDEFAFEMSRIRIQIGLSLGDEKVPEEYKDLVPETLDWGKFEQKFKCAQQEMERLLNPSELIAASRAKMS